MNYDHCEVSILRDIRRRGKNLIAAHNCRQRKLGQVEVGIYLLTYTQTFSFIKCNSQELNIRVAEAKKNIEQSKKYQSDLLKQKANLEKLLQQCEARNNQYITYMTKDIF